MQTRRVMEPQPPHHEFSRHQSERLNIKTNGGQYVKCPYGAPGDYLWVGETWAVLSIDSVGRQVGLGYCADGEFSPDMLVYPRAIPEDFDLEKAIAYLGRRWRPAMFMPLWVSRIMLEVQSVRVERLKHISSDDCIAEGVTARMAFVAAVKGDRQGWGDAHAASFANLWDDINARRGFGWDADPWVWVIEFKNVSV